MSSALPSASAAAVDVASGATVATNDDDDDADGNRCKRMNGGHESDFDGILMNGHTQKHDAIQKQKCSIDDKNVWEYTHNNQHPPVRLFCGRREIRGKNCSGWQMAVPNRTG